MLKKLKSIFYMLLLGVYAKRGVKADCIIRVAVLNLIALLGSLYILFWFNSFATDRISYMIFAILTIIIFVSSFILLHIKAGIKYLGLIKSVVTLNLVLFYSFIYFTFKYGSLWAFLVPSMVILLMKLKKGIIISFIYLLIIATIDIVFKVHSLELFTRFLFVFFAQLLLVSTYEMLTTKLKKEIRKLTYIDYLTSLHNHRFFINTIKRKIPSATKREENICFLAIDADKFKNYNDTYGHLQGDKLLAAIAKVLRKNARRCGDYAFRLGGEEFLVMLCGTSHANGVLVAEKIRKEVSELKVKYLENEDTSITVSIGVASVIPKKDSDFEDLIKKADDNLYKAKNSGRNQVIDS